MVAKARGDLFDVSMGGAGFHFTSHLIAIVALFIACFAIAGYISYRSDSIPSSALKDQDPDFDDIKATTLELSGDLTVDGTVSKYGLAETVETQTVTVPATATKNVSITVPAFTQPANSYLTGLSFTTQNVLTCANAAGADIFDYRVGTSASGAELCALTEIIGRNESWTAGTTLTVLRDGSPTASQLTANTETFNADGAAPYFVAPNYSSTSREVHVSFLPANSNDMVHSVASVVTVKMYFTSSV